LRDAPVADGRRRTATEAPTAAARLGATTTDEKGQRYPAGPIGVVGEDLHGVQCFVCLDEGCEWCPAVDLEAEPHPPEPPGDAA
jgi:hypothetical protein